MFDWIKEFLFNLFSTFFGYLWDVIKTVVTTLVGYAVEMFLWFWELVFWVFDSLMRFLWSLANPVLLAGFEAVESHIPNGLMEAIVASYSWLQYVNAWVPVGYCITLFIAYYSIAISLYCLRTTLSFLPFGRA